MEPFRVRLNCVDHYQAIPSRFDPQLQDDHQDEAAHESVRTRVPVIRVFGATQSGQKVCAHIHGALPYIYVEYDGSLTTEEVDAYIQRLYISIDHALAISYRRNLNDGKAKFVAYITLVKGTPFYGYFEGYKFYLKIYLFNPLHITRLSDLLRQGAVMKKFVQPYESHLQYILQWMCDYNLYGCDYIDCGTAVFRSPVPAFEDVDSLTDLWHSGSISPHLISDPTEISRQSHCSIEVDICVRDILNRKEIKPRMIHHDFLERADTSSSDEKLVQSMASLWKDETRRRKARMPNADPGSSPFLPEDLISMSAEPRSSQRGGWIHEEEYMGIMRRIILEEQEKHCGPKITFDSYKKVTPLASITKSTLESVEDLYPENLRLLLASRKGYAPNGVAGKIDLDDNVDVDESRIHAIGEADVTVGLDNDILGEADSSSESPKDPVNAIQMKNSNNAQVDTTKRRENPEGTSQRVPDGGSPILMDMAGYGIHGTKQSFEAEDTFDIPLDYTTGRDAARLPSKRVVSVQAPLTKGRPSKRRRILQDKEGARVESRAADKKMHRWSDSKTSARVDHKFASDPRSTLRLKRSGQSANSSPKASQESLTRASQESIKLRTPNANRSLSFTVVKDPLDPTTISRLSQQSDLSQDARRETRSKTVSFDSIASRGDGSATTLKGSTVSYSDGSGESSSTVNELIRYLDESFDANNRIGRTIFIRQAPPTASYVNSTMQSYGIVPVIYQEAYYSNNKDVPARIREYAGRGFRLGSNTTPFLPDFDPIGTAVRSFRNDNSPSHSQPSKLSSKSQRICGLNSWEIALAPPSRTEVESWLLQQGPGQQKISKESLSSKHQAPRELPTSNISQVDGPTQRNRYGFKFSQKKKSTGIRQESQYMSLMSLEIHVNTRWDLVPNPEEDEIACVFWCCHSDNSFGYNCQDDETAGLLVLSDGGRAKEISHQYAVDVEEEATELELINRMVDIVRAYDPDILTGYEVHGSSWGYMIERARCKYEYNLCNEFSRMKSQSHGRFGKENDRWGFNHTSTISVTGRHMINIWRAMRGELNLLQYTFENVAFHLLHRRLPHYSHRDLTTWFKSSKPKDQTKVLDYYLTRVRINLSILEKNELIPRTSEQARILGVDFFAVFSRGSQFKVESLMFRIAKAEGFILISPNRKQVGGQNALECLPLVMEPQSDFYTSPLLVLDFQSLYPSIMIAYNYCYSTFLGRIVGWRGQNKMGFTDYKRQPQILELLENHLNIAPNGMLYVKPDIRKSLLAKMLGEILETRVMVKSGMKIDKEDKALQQLLNNRQLALKLIANVTYGYTSASFSGRMPCSEIADSIVQTARETLEKAIALIHSVERWNAEVVYGDTDSLFVYLRGRSKDEAFVIGAEIAEKVTKMNPRPVKLKFEKVYLPSVLLAKKRYVGFKYENKAQATPVFDAKGIETVRRDGTPAEQKIEETALKILFRTADLSRVKEYFQGQCNKIMQGKVSIQDFCFAKEVKLGTYSDRGPPPPGALISARKMLHDPRSEPQYGERVPYVVITGAPGARLIDRCVAPESLLRNHQNELDAEYYITKNIIPPLERIFNLVGANVRGWYDEMPKFQRTRHGEGTDISITKDSVIMRKTLESYMKSSHCLVCREKLEADIPICDTCQAQNDTSLFQMRRRLGKAEKKAINLEEICRSCASLPFGEEVKCDSKDCPVFYTRTRHLSTLRSTKITLEPVSKYLEELRTNIYDW